MKRLAVLALIPWLILSCTSGGSDKEMNQLKEGFNNPPNSARTQVWWHWMNGNITKDGIKKDLEWMDRIGLGGFHHFDAAMSTPTIVDKRLIYMDEGWKDAFAYATRLADSLGLEMTVASAPGWSSTGGPWVEPKDAMKKLVWRTSVVNGGRKISMSLPEPYRTTGAFQNGVPAGRGEAANNYEYYEDIVTLAVKLPEGNRTMAEMGAKVTSSGGHFTIEQLSDGDVANSEMLPSGKSGSAWIMFEFPKAETIKSATIVGPSGASLEASNDGVRFNKVCDLRGGRTTQSTISIPETTAKYFRVVVANPRAQRGMFDFGGGNNAPAPRGTAIAELDLHPYTKVHHAEDKAAYSSSAKLALMPTPTSKGEVFPSVEDVVDLTSMVGADGRIDWAAPQGKWKIYRFGWSLTGKQNHPAPPEATGLEVDKLDPIAWTKFFHTYLDMYKDASDGLMGKKGLQYVLTDSYEAEHQTWTPAMFEEFKTRRGYDMLKWMPVLAGEVIGSPEESDKFLWDWRMNISDLYAANYDLLTEIAQKDYGMLGRYGESHEAGRAFMGDGMDVKRTAQVPMSAMWCAAPWLGRTPDGDYNREVYMADDRESASVAHIYGQNVAAAESMTDIGGPAYAYCPENLKFVADIELANGINRFVIHESAHQPSDVHVPGLSLGGCGQWFNRHDTWAEMANVWTDYMARSCFMLQAGKNVADILYYYGEDNSVCSEFGRFPSMPKGYEWDYCNPHALINAINPRNGKLVSKGGTEYEMLLMDRNMEYVSVKVLRRIAELADAGVVISAVKPQYAASLADDKAEFDALVADIFESGRKNVYVDTPIDEVLKSEGLEPDVIMDPDMKYLHRTMKNTEIYWINKAAKDYRSVKLSFRTNGMKPTLWHPDTGLIEDVTYHIDGDRTVVELDMVPDDAVFVVFNGNAEDSYTVPEKKENTVLTVQSPWRVKFQEGRGAPAERVFDKLQCYTQSEEFGIKYFSGVASYNNTIVMEEISGDAVIDLGSVKNIAEVYVNGEYCGTAWKEPFRVDVSKALVKGENRIEVKVANMWVNRLIGDQQPNCPEKITFTDSRTYREDSTLLPAGLLGPVKVIEIN